MKGHWIKNCEKFTSTLSCSRRVAVEGLELIISAREQALIDWVPGYLYPLVSPAELENSTQPFRLNCIYSDTVVACAIEDINSDPRRVKVVEGYRHRPCYIWDDDTNKRRILISAIEGIVWICNESEQTITLVYSSRTRWPALELSRTARAVITQFLHSKDWFLCHAGAVTTRNENLMIVGKSGAGKTTLILALLQSGAGYIANELLFVKPCEKGLRVLSYALPIAVGLGTALQFQAIADLLNKPYRLQYPPRRLRIEKLAKISREEWINQKSKLQILPSELAMTFPDSTTTGSAIISKLVVPKVNFEPMAPKAKCLTPEKAMDVFSSNLVSISHEEFPAPWLKTGFKPSELRSDHDLVERTSKLPAVEFEYHVSLNSSKNDGGFPHFLNEINQSHV